VTTRERDLTRFGTSDGTSLIGTIWAYQHKHDSQNNLDLVHLYARTLHRSCSQAAMHHVWMVVVDVKPFGSLRLNHKYTNTTSATATAAVLE
jgi:hypothetical protein